MARFEDIGEQDSWRCWICDEPVDATMSVNDDRGPSVDARMTDRKAKKKGKGKSSGSADLPERLAHRGCNTGKGNVEAVVPWNADLFVIDPVPIVQTVDRLANKGGREIFCRCPSPQDADDTAAWLIDRISRLEPGLTLSSDIQEGGGQYLVALRT
ncbi:MAG: hypothetical protein HOJ85_05640 [Ilumatobacter sp.]|jgi:hypothetical protein|uniref:hypothetical protein n=1 Tax=Ilumatobacter sp. TaxID=1967498 RepID=UPI001D9AADB8|nr:hypothetical protein [Ilumatobacter sp.]MBT5275812.1 hypothetical protein [Ilumatobacter sp.]MBT5553226.1 hypothetical protein [Ilumatobacter sp.]MBT5864980.1 hypothetical protein [Ilumatobacter sp.]MBT7429265.1 hypothetical protein [Ilumatobacter sp.]